MFVGLAFGHFEVGVSVAFGAFSVGFGDMGGIRRRRYWLLPVMGLFAAVCGLLGPILGNSIAAGAVGMFAIAFVAAMSLGVSQQLYGVLFGGR